VGRAVIRRRPNDSALHGADDYEKDDGRAYTLTAVRGGEEVSSLSVNVTGDAIHVRWVETLPAHRSRGIATSLVREAVRLWPGRAVGTNGTTDDGEAFWGRLVDAGLAEPAGGG